MSRLSYVSATHVSDLCESSLTRTVKEIIVYKYLNKITVYSTLTLEVLFSIQTEKNDKVICTRRKKNKAKVKQSLTFSLFQVLSFNVFT